MTKIKEEVERLAFIVLALALVLHLLGLDPLARTDWDLIFKSFFREDDLSAKSGQLHTGFYSVAAMMLSGREDAMRDYSIETG